MAVAIDTRRLQSPPPKYGTMDSFKGMKHVDSFSVHKHNIEKKRAAGKGICSTP